MCAYGFKTTVKSSSSAFYLVFQHTDFQIFSDKTFTFCIKSHLNQHFDFPFNVISQNFLLFVPGKLLWETPVFFL